jgi:hypothetical protein
MSNQLWPIEISCDAPSYFVVQACEKLHFRKPLDVRWCRLSHFLNEGSASLRLLNFLFIKNVPEKKTCSCGQPLPLLEDYAFTFACGKVLNYGLAQCARCGTIFWEDGVNLGPSDSDAA